MDGIGLVHSTRVIICLGGRERRVLNLNLPWVETKFGGVICGPE